MELYVGLEASFNRKDGKEAGENMGKACENLHSKEETIRSLLNGHKKNSLA
jgi:hypothetical protein